MEGVPYSKEFLESLLPYATPIAQDRIKQLIKYGTARKASKATGLAQSTLVDSVTRTKRKAARQGYSPIEDEQGVVPEGYLVKGKSILYDAAGNVEKKWVKSQTDKEQQIEILRESLESLCEDVPRLKPIKPPKHLPDDLMAVYPMGDPHFGMLAWSKETGDDFDLKIAERDLFAAVDYLVSHSPPAKKAVLINLGDFYHAENMEGITTKSGNVLDMDSRFPRMIDVGFRALRRCITRLLEKHEEVEVINSPGNHDETIAFFLSIALRNMYEKEPRITIRSEPTQRHYIEFGKVLIGTVHGHRTKDRDLPGIMATEMPESWGRTKFRYFYRGHHHHDERLEFHGCQVEQFRTLAAGDAYAVGNGYLSGRDMKSIVHHKEFGERVRFTCGIDVVKSSIGKE